MSLECIDLRGLTCICVCWHGAACHPCMSGICIAYVCWSRCIAYVCWSRSAHLQVLGFKDGPGLRVLVLAACCSLAYATSCLACKVFA